LKVPTVRADYVEESVPERSLVDGSVAQTVGDLTATKSINMIKEAAINRFFE
jgi:hypothetical protein